MQACFIFLIPCLSGVKMKSTFSKGQDNCRVKTDNYFHSLLLYH
jgi:hypothetical protein